MKRTLCYTITDRTHTNVREFLKAQGFSTQNLIALKKQEGCLLRNGQPVFITEPLQIGDTLTVHIPQEECSEKIPPVELPLHIVYEDEDLLVADKPAGMPVHPSANNYGNSLANALAWYFACQNKPFVFRCINRLDKDTSGLTIIAKHMVSASILSGMVANKGAQGIRNGLGLDIGIGIEREYLAIVRGSLPKKQGTIAVPIARKEGSVIERIPDPERGERAVTHYQVIKEANGHSLLSLRLETGRTHQIRVHMKYLGFPLIGDYLYNPDMEFINRQALHSHRLRFVHPITGKVMELCSPLPPDMEVIIKE